MFLSVQPLSRTRSLSRECFCVPNVSVPVKRSRRLLGGSQHTSPEETTEKTRGNIIAQKLRRFESYISFLLTICVCVNCIAQIIWFWKKLIHLQTLLSSDHKMRLLFSFKTLQETCQLGFCSGEKSEFYLRFLSENTAN